MPEWCFIANIYSTTGTNAYSACTYGLLHSYKRCLWWWWSRL